jgi:hypothetical protein
MEGCEEKWFKQRAKIEFSTVEKIPSIDIYPCMQAVYRNKCVEISKVTLGERVQARSGGSKIVLK